MEPGRILHKLITACDDLWRDMPQCAKARWAADERELVTGILTAEADGEYIPFGPEWEKEMMRWKKKDLVGWIRRLLIQYEQN
ncbi:MAG: hypothetical protein APR55_08190 [Methanolinea sp. SDB]|nr:MAG: hypothetical protein APR55_08190 [Methanolinea sp. SDB]